jgi:hypothetical protein
VTQPIPPEKKARLMELIKQIGMEFISPRITLIVRSPEEGNTVGTLVLSSDNPTAALEALRQHAVEEAERFAREGRRSGEPGAEFPIRRNLDEI